MAGSPRSDPRDWAGRSRSVLPTRGDRLPIRTRLGWPQNLPVILLIGGGDGMGPVAKWHGAISDAHLNTALVVVTCRNDKLKAQLEAEECRCLPLFMDLCARCPISCVARILC